MPQYDFCGWATKNDILCSDGRTIRRDAFKDCDGKTVPIVWNHQHNSIDKVLGHGVLRNTPDGVRIYGVFNDTEDGQRAKMLVNHGDVTSLSIYANQLRQRNNDVLHGNIREVSLVLAGANPGAFIDSVISHGDGNDEAVIFSGEEIDLEHSEEVTEEVTEDADSVSEEKKGGTEMNEELLHKDGENEESNDEETVADVFNTLSEKQKTVVYALIGEALSAADDTDDNEEEDQDMKHNLFDKENETQRNTLSHADQKAILDAARNSRGSFREVLGAYVEDNYLQHADGDDDTAPVSGFTEDYFEYLFPEYKDVRPGAPELVTNDQTWVNAVMQKVHKSPFNRIRTRQVDVREIAALRAKGYDKGTKKALTGNYALIHRTTDPQTVYVKNALNRDDILDITDFDYVQYQYNIDRLMLDEELAIAVMLGDGRQDDDADKIHPEHIRPIWTDDELYTIHTDIDLDATQSEIQGSGTGTYFGENFIYAESIINASLYAREQYRGSGTPDFFCDPHLVNVMLLARDRTGRRIYSDVNDLAKALNVGKIYTAEQFANKTRTFTPQGGSETTKKLLGIFVNLADYNMGAAKGGQIAKFNQFDIDFNQEKSLIETRTSGALTRIKSAIVLEEDVTSNP